MSPSTGKSPLVDRPATAEPSPARESLVSNLEADADPTLSLKKKRSWFGSLRDVVHRGAKVAFDTFKHDSQKTELQNHAADTKDAEMEVDGSGDDASPQRPSMDSMTTSLVSSATPMRGSTERRHNLRSKVASASLRQHLAGHKKRGSVYSVAERPDSEVANYAGPEEFVPLSPKDDRGITHTRRSSLAGSIVGSLRGVSRRVGKAKPPRPESRMVSPEVPEDIVPLPTSPIDIPIVPATAPSLDLDLGLGGFMPPEFTRSPERAQAEPSIESKKLMDPANITSGVPPPTPVFEIGEPPMRTRASFFMRPVTPRELLKIPVDHAGPSLPPGPQTPMPGTSFALEVDGANSEKSDKSHVFERSVTPSLERERRELRKMRSLDAMAEACAIAHANDELSQTDNTTLENLDDSGIAFLDEQSARPRSPRRDNVSSGTTQTLHSCPSEMPELTRQCTPDNARQVAVVDARFLLEDTAVSVYEDPFDDSNAVRSGPVSPERSRPPSPDRIVELPFRPKINLEADSAVTAVDEEHDRIGEQIEETTESHEQYHTSTSQNSQIQPQAPTEHTEQYPEEIVNPFENPILDGDNHDRVNQFITSDLVLPHYNDIDPFASEGLTPRDSPAIPAPLHLAGEGPNSSPRSTRYRSTYTAGLGDTEYKFSFDSWLKDTSNAGAPESQPTTPHRRRMDISLDSVSTNEERKTPGASPTTTTIFEGTPTMQNRFCLGSKRPEGNIWTSIKPPTRTPRHQMPVSISRRGPPRFILGASDETEASSLRLANFEHAFAGSREATPQQKSKAFQTRVGSEDSVADSLKNAAFNYSQLEERLADVPQSDPEDVFADPVEDAGYDDLLSDGYQGFSNSPTNQESDVPAPLQASKHEATHLTVLPNESSLHFEFKPHFESNPQSQAGSSPLPTHSKTPTSLEAKPIQATSSPGTVTGRSDKARLASGDTLDRSLNLFMSSESGYQADESSVYQPDSSVSKARPTRYRSRRSRGNKPLSEMSHNSR